MKKNSNQPTVYISMNEYKVIQMGMATILETFKAPEKTEDLINWTPEALKYRKDITAAANSVAAKIEKVTGIKAILPDYNLGDENEFLTKES